MIDIFPTLIELCGLTKKPELDGMSLVPVIKNPNYSRKEPVITMSEERHTSVVDRRYRLIRYSDGTEELYDRKNDSHEWKNRAADPDLNTVKERLARFVPQKWAAPVLSKKAFQFNPKTYTWKHKKTGRIIEGRKTP